MDDNFLPNFEPYKTVPMAIYGLGDRTNSLLKFLQGFLIVSITAQHRIGQTLYNYPILAIEELLDKVKVIVIAAQNRSVKTIYSRIKFVEDKGITVLDMSGESLRTRYSAEATTESVLSTIQKQVFSAGDIILFNLISKKISKNQLKIDSMFELGYFCFGPFTLKLINWFKKTLENQDDAIILFSSRDGYLLQKIYRDRAVHSSLRLPDSHYLYISRRAVTVASIRSEDDIARIVGTELIKTIGNLQIRLEEHLGISFDDTSLNRSLMSVIDRDKDLILQYVFKHKDAILQNAEHERKNYLKYLHSLNLSDYRTCYLFDLYSAGTCFRKFKDLSGIETQLLCLGTKTEIVNSLSLYGHMSSLSSSYFVKLYQLFEIIYASSEGQLKSIDPDGRPIFLDGSEYNFDKVKKIQRGIIEFLSDFEEMPQLSLNFVDALCGMMFRTKSVISENIKEAFIYDDRFGSSPSSNIFNELI
jgi:hypothetical protein